MNQDQNTSNVFQELSLGNGRFWTCPATANEVRAFRTGPFCLILFDLKWVAEITLKYVRDSRMKSRIARTDSQHNLASRNELLAKLSRRSQSFAQSQIFAAILSNIFSVIQQPEARIVFEGLAHPGSRKII